jgi:hypothetical protein
LTCHAAIDAPGGFLFEWWSVFWDIFIARTNEKHSEVAAAYLEVDWESPNRLIIHHACIQLLLIAQSGPIYIYMDRHSK